MNMGKQARVLRQWYQREKIKAAAKTIVAKDVFISVDSRELTSKKRPSVFSLVVDHDEGRIVIPFNSEILGTWKKELSDISLAYWNAGQCIPYGTHRGGA